MRLKFFNSMLLLAAILLINISSACASIIEDKVIFVGSATYPPFQWIDKEGEEKGFIIDLQEILAEAGGLSAEHRLMDWNKALGAVLAGEADVIPMLESEARGELFDFSEPFYYLAHGIFSRRSESYNAIEELKGETVAVVAGSFASSRLENDAYNIKVLKVNTERECLEAVHDYVANACIEVVVTSRHMASELDVEQTSAPFWPQPYVFAVREGDGELIEWLNQQMARVHAEGQYHEIYRKWLPELEWHEHSVYDWIGHLLLILIPLSIAGLAGYTAAWYLKRKVALRTKQLTDELKVREKLEKMLRKKADFDELTGLPSRSSFIEKLGVIVKENEEASPTVMLARLLNLEQLISLFGYHYGYEKVIKGFADHLVSVGFPLVSHFGSGVFAIYRDKEMSHEEIVDFMDHTFEIENLMISAQVSIGISEGRAETEHKSLSESEELVRRATTAYSSAIRSGQPWKIYSLDVEPNSDDLMLVEDFKRNGTKDMFLLFQPKLDLRTGKVHEAEALVRWKHPSLGMVPPGHFVSLLEETGLVTKLTSWVLEEAILEVERFRGVIPSFSVSVNVSARDLQDEDFLVDLICGKSSQWFPGGVCLEITETGVIEDYEHVQEVLNVLHDSGIRSSVDDFGIGYASLSYLSRFSVDEVKLDRSFINNMLVSNKNRLIVASTISLAHDLGLKVTAEGVEDLATLQALAEMGCDTAQGYVISRPITPQELYPMLERAHFVEHLKVSESVRAGLER
ncbi:EAL domain-containing protein [Billgrantia antri]|uniref:EAL domain-containing protein n=1 Tax=Halomonas sulfidivorans TaxID=2733488 RepID=A0ABX7WHC3_9GAMM|nr:EAL domain-containing protein [Halomonas sulfidivorans]QTP59525.1 EAL domain-containing protein [Halomonas sulfidivorans]